MKGGRHNEFLWKKTWQLFCRAVRVQISGSNFLREIWLICDCLRITRLISGAPIPSMKVGIWPIITKVHARPMSVPVVFIGNWIGGVVVPREINLRSTINFCMCREVVMKKIHLLVFVGMTQRLMCPLGHSVDMLSCARLQGMVYTTRRESRLSLSGALIRP